MADELKVVKLPEIEDKRILGEDEKRLDGGALNPSISGSDFDFVLVKGDTMTGQLIISGNAGTAVQPLSEGYDTTMLELSPVFDNASNLSLIAMAITSIIDASTVVVSDYTALYIFPPEVTGSFATDVFAVGIDIWPQSDEGGTAKQMGIIIRDQSGGSVNSRAIRLMDWGIENGIQFNNNALTLYFKEDITSRLAIAYSDTLEAVLSTTIFTQTADKTVATTATETTIIGTGIGTVTISTPVLKHNSGSAGRTIRITARGIYGTDAITPGTLNIRVKLGSTTVVSTGDIAATAALTNRYWEMTTYITCRTSGTTGTVQGHGAFLHDDALATAALSIWQMVNTGATTINTTIAQAIDVTADWSVSDADNTITCQILTVEIIN